MKKITFTLLAAFFLFGSAISQPIISVQAPLYNGSNSSLSTPSGSNDAVYHRSCWLVLANELTGLPATASVVSGFGIDFFQGVTGAPVTGQFTVYLQNVFDVSYNKGTSWAGCLTGMLPYYQGPFTIPVTNNFTSVVVPLSTNFNYTPGGAIYVAIDWYAPTAASTQWARSQCNTSGLPTTGGVRGIAPAAGPAPTTLSTTAFRPSFRFEAANTATNDASVLSVKAMGQSSKLAGAGEIVSAQVRNTSGATMTNITVTLTVSGANSFVNTQTITSLTAGTTTNVNFSPFVPTTNGNTNMMASVSSDQVNNNNSATWTQSVNCNIVANAPPFPVGSYTSLCYGGGASGGIVAMKYTSGTNASSVVAVTCVVPSFSNALNAGNSLSAVLCDASGAILQQGNPVTLSATNMDVFTSFNFTSPQALTPNTDYYLGLLTTTGTNFPFGTSATTLNVLGHYRIPLAGGAPVLTNLQNISLSATLSFSNTNISVSASKTVACKGSTLSLTATGLSTYTWTPGSLTGSTIPVTAALAGTATSGVMNYQVIGTETVSGCKSSVAAITISVTACPGFATNNPDATEIKLFPNPSVNGKSTITGLKGTNTIMVYNTLGQAVLTQVVAEESTVIDLSNLPNGNYLFKITNEENLSKTIKVVNQN